MNTGSILDPWMNVLLRFAACFNVVAGICMLLFYHEGFKLLHIPNPVPVFPIHLNVSPK